MVRKNPFDQAVCQSCKGWHFALQLDKDFKITELKCCRCNRLIKYPIDITKAQ